MAAPASTRPYAESVTITLTSIRRTQDGTRHIVLHPDEPVIVGRSSRSEVKNLSSSTDNALFDCPVVSRRHAEFTLNTNKWDAKDMHKIYITDTESMHGTSVNSQKLQPLKRFHLRVGDVIRLGDSVNHGQNSYDGVMVTLDCISVAGQKESTQVKSVQRGISCPSGSEADSDDDSVQEIEAPSSAQTTPDQPEPFGSSIANGIVLDNDNDPEHVVRRRVSKQTTQSGALQFEQLNAVVPRITARSIVVPDTYAEDSYDAPDNAPNMERTLQFDDAVTDYSRTIAEEEEGGAMFTPGAEESEMHFSDDAQSRASNDDNTSDAASSHHSFGSEPDSMSDFQDDDEHDGWGQRLDYDDDQDDEEGPEIMSSKRTQSVEIGTLGNGSDDHEYQPSDAPPCEPAVLARPHYDPVRGMFQMAAAPSVDNAPTVRAYDSFPPPSHSGVYADVWNSSKWDVGPNDVSANNVTFQEISNSWADRNTFEGAFEQDYWATPKLAPAHAKWSKHDVPDVAPTHTVCDGSKKRKASDISTGFVPMATAPEYQSSVTEDMQPHRPLFVFSEHEDEPEVSVISAAADEPLTVEPQPKKRKTKQPRTKKSMLRAAAIEATKYTAGAIIGGIGLVTILASPIGEALASC